ncbi:MAG TPA: hypothetical protein PLB35_02725 [Myxococcota bacterium]|mgnify:FL=1|nr:hypothetical protein [Myxococcota bacterium]HOA12689.1 hypothetical protein [Myxococcota bacterium]HOH76145.1 hypothetical protein [Myxococcota bacterium]
MQKFPRRILGILVTGLLLAGAGCPGEPQEVVMPDLPEWFPDKPQSPDFALQRKDGGTFPTPEEVDGFTETYSSFLKRTDFIGWIDRHAQGLAPDNPWGMSDYKIWWAQAFMTRSGDLVTLAFRGPPDNTTQSVGRVLGATAGLYMQSEDETARNLSMGLVRGLSATFDGMIWGDEDPVIDTIMARTIFNRSHETMLRGNRRLFVDYEGVRFEEVELRHDTIHNRDNPTWGDIFVRNKRSKDDFPFLYRNMAMLVELAFRTDDPEVRRDIVRLVGQVRGMTADIVEHDYCIRTKGFDSKPYIPLMQDGTVEDFATYRAYESFVPLGECTGKLSTAYLASGEALGNVCENADTAFYGDGYLYEELAIAAHFCATDLIWNYHVAALAMALLFDDIETARKLVEGLAARIDGLWIDERAADYPEWWPEVAQLLVLSAAYGMPLTGDEARLIQSVWRDSAVFYQDSVCWDPWDPSVPDGTVCEVMPSRYETDDQGQTTRAHTRIEEFLSPFEYCASPYRATTGAMFVNCERLVAAMMDR